MRGRDRGRCARLRWRRLIVQDSRQLPFADRSFDTVTFVACLNHIPYRDEALAEAVRVLRPGGRVVATMIGRWLGLVGHKIWWYSEEKHRGWSQVKHGAERRRNAATAERCWAAWFGIHDSCRLNHLTWRKARFANLVRFGPSCSNDQWPPASGATTRPGTSPRKCVAGVDLATIVAIAQAKRQSTSKGPSVRNAWLVTTSRNRARKVVRMALSMGTLKPRWAGGLSHERRAERCRRKSGLVRPRRRRAVGNDRASPHRIRRAHDREMAREPRVHEPCWPDRLSAACPQANKTSDRHANDVLDACAPGASQ